MRSSSMVRRGNDDAAADEPVWSKRKYRLEYSRGLEWEPSKRNAGNSVDVSVRGGLARGFGEHLSPWAGDSY